jgi:hypothetical protein
MSWRRPHHRTTKRDQLCFNLFIGTPLLLLLAFWAVQVIIGSIMAMPIIHLLAMGILAATIAGVAVWASQP